MPIVDIELVTEPNDVLVAGLAQSIADAVGVSLNSSPGQVWVRMRVLALEVAALTSSIARIAGRNPACVHIEYAPAAAGRLSFGGRLVE